MASMKKFVKPSPVTKPKKLSELEELLMIHLRAARLESGLVREYRFAAEACGGTGQGVRARLKEAGMRDWRLDFAWPEKKLAIECEGGIWNGGRNTTGAGFEEDTFKYNALTLMGWRLLRFTSTAIKSGVALQTVEAALSMQWSQAWQVTA